MAAVSGAAHATNLAYASQLANYVVQHEEHLRHQPLRHFHPKRAGCGCDHLRGLSVDQVRNIHDFVTNLYNALVAKGVGSTKIMLPESQNWQDPHNLAGPAMTDPMWRQTSALLPITIMTADNGTYDPTSYTLWQGALGDGGVPALRRNRWHITNGVYYARRIFLFMTVAQANAWHYWWLVPSANQTKVLWISKPAPPSACLPWATTAGLCARVITGLT